MDALVSYSDVCKAIVLRMDATTVVATSKTCKGMYLVCHAMLKDIYSKLLPSQMQTLVDKFLHIRYLSILCDHRPLMMTMLSNLVDNATSVAVECPAQLSCTYVDMDLIYADGRRKSLMNRPLLVKNVVRTYTPYGDMDGILKGSFIIHSDMYGGNGIWLLKATNISVTMTEVPLPSRAICMVGFLKDFASVICDDRTMYTVHEDPDGEVDCSYTGISPDDRMVIPFTYPILQREAARASVYIAEIDKIPPKEGAPFGDNYFVEFEDTEWYTSVEIKGGVITVICGYIDAKHPHPRLGTYRGIMHNEEAIFVW